VAAPGKSTVPVTILGHEYRVRGESDPDGVRRAAALVDETASRIRRRGTVDSLDVAVLAALNLARQLVALREGALAGPPGQAVDGERLDELLALLEAAVADAPRAVS